MSANLGSGENWGPLPEGWLPKNPPPSVTPWKVDRDPRENEYRIYEVPDVGDIRLIARCDRKVDAELIVQLHTTYREGNA